jgi:hypothetical protein
MNDDLDNRLHRAFDAVSSHDPSSDRRVTALGQMRGRIVDHRRRRLTRIAGASSVAVVALVVGAVAGLPSNEGGTRVRTLGDVHDSPSPTVAPGPRSTAAPADATTAAAIRGFSAAQVEPVTPAPAPPAPASRHPGPTNVPPCPPGPDPDPQPAPDGPNGTNSCQSSATPDTTTPDPNNTVPVCPAGSPCGLGPTREVTRLSPTSGPVSGGTAVTVTGSGLSDATEVLFGNLHGTNVKVISDTEIQVTTPASPGAGSVGVAVNFSDGSGSGYSLQFTYE